MLDYEARVEEERLMWQPHVEAEQKELERRERREERKKERWRSAFPVVSSPAPPEGVTVHRDGSRLYNELMIMREEERRWRDENRYQLTPAIVVAEILRFIDIAPGRSTAAASEEPLYSTIGQELRINKRYVDVRDSRGRKKHGYNIYATGMFYLDTRLQLDNIQAFIDEIRRAEALGSHWVPESVKILSSFAQSFLTDHKTEMNEIQREEIGGLARLAARTVHARGRVDLVYKLVEPFRGEKKWSHEKVDKLWAYVFSFMIEPLVIAEYQAPLLARLQHSFLFLFRRYADSLYSFGCVPKHLNGEFALYEPTDVDPAAAAASSTSTVIGGSAAATAAAAASRSSSSTATEATVVPAGRAVAPTARRFSIASSTVSHPGGGGGGGRRVVECAVAVRETRCLLWNSDEFLSAMLTGVQTRARLGSLDSLDSVFSRAFEEELAVERGAEGERADSVGEPAAAATPLSIMTIRAALQRAARGCTRVLTHQFMAALTKEGRLSAVLKDAKSIFTGAALCAYAGSLRGGAAVRPNEVREAFSRSLLVAKIPMDRRERWTVDTAEKYGRVVVRLEWPLGYVVHPPLLSILDDARHLILTLLRCAEIIMDVQCDVEHPVAEDCRRPFLLLMRDLLQLITVITDLFFKQAQRLVDRYFARIDASITVDDAKGHADALHDRLRDLVGSSGIRKMVRELVDMFCNMVEEIHLYLLSGKITSMEVYKWSKVVERERAMLITMGENMSNNVLADLYTILTTGTGKGKEGG